MRTFPDAKPKLLIEPDRVRVSAENVEEGTFRASVDVADERVDKPRGQALRTMGWSRTHGADLTPARKVQALARHRDQLAVTPQPDVAPEFDRSLQERAGISHATNANRACAPVSAAYTT
jgi:hypothetical protein